MTQWAEETHLRIAAAIKRYRGEMSAQQLSERTAELGYPLSRSQIANYESGRKKNLDIAELLVIAAALNLPPALLLYPDLPDGDVEVLPGQHVPSQGAIVILSGDIGGTFDSDGLNLMSLSRDLWGARDLARYRLDSVTKLLQAINSGDQLDAKTLGYKVKASLELAAESLKQVPALEDRIRRIPGAVVVSDGGVMESLQAECDVLRHWVDSTLKGDDDA